MNFGMTDINKNFSRVQLYGSGQDNCFESFTRTLIIVKMIKESP